MLKNIDGPYFYLCAQTRALDQRPNLLEIIVMMMGLFVLSNGISGPGQNSIGVRNLPLLKAHRGKDCAWAFSASVNRPIHY